MPVGPLIDVLHAEAERTGRKLSRVCISAGLSASYVHSARTHSTKFASVAKAFPALTRLGYDPCAVYEDGDVVELASIRTRYKGEAMLPLAPLQALLSASTRTAPDIARQARKHPDLVRQLRRGTRYEARNKGGGARLITHVTIDTAEAIIDALGLRLDDVYPYEEDT